MSTPIAATITRDRHGQPLLTLNGGPFHDTELSPHGLRLLAQQLMALAEMAQRLPIGGKHYRPTTVHIGTQITPTQGQPS